MVPVAFSVPTDDLLRTIVLGLVMTTLALLAGYLIASKNLRTYLPVVVLLIISTVIWMLQMRTLKVPHSTLEMCKYDGNDEEMYEKYANKLFVKGFTNYTEVEEFQTLEDAKKSYPAGIIWDYNLPKNYYAVQGTDVVPYKERAAVTKGLTGVGTAGLPDVASSFVSGLITAYI